MLEIVHDPSGDATATDVSDVTHDSRATHPGALFCCIPGLPRRRPRLRGRRRRPGRRRAHGRARRSRPRCPRRGSRSVRRAIGPVAARFHGEPSRAVPVLGVTGTNGKTTTTFFLEAILAAARSCGPGVIGTLGVRFEGDVDADAVHDARGHRAPARARRRCARRGADAVAMEVSSHALAEHRVDGTVFAAACFTNLSRDHLDLHGSLDEYFAAKARLFTPEFTDARRDRRRRPARCRARDARARRRGSTVRTFALDAPGRRAPRGASRATRTGTTGRLTLGATTASTSSVPIPGRFNAANALAAAATASHLGIDAATIARGIAAVAPVPGRFERIASAAPVDRGRRLRPHPRRHRDRARGAARAHGRRAASSRCSGAVATGTRRSGADDGRGRGPGRRRRGR